MHIRRYSTTRIPARLLDLNKRIYGRRSASHLPHCPPALADFCLSVFWCACGKKKGEPLPVLICDRSAGGCRERVDLSI
ncbi:hypothetical protein [Pandoravirus japonicus]|uniref:Uncharacterized protein n=1 Tax=Pandoravirus japonicus TaxID=2823154 RepID=A0A811BQC3_9VIRU|nr:hypothetical protein [Pandoravirus japonicus]